MTFGLPKTWWKRRIAAVPMRYDGCRFRSTLEANWAYNLDCIGIPWSYEPWAVRVGDTRYLVDFHLPNQNVWLEIKGPHDHRIEKPRRIHDAASDPFDRYSPLVIIGRAPVCNRLTWHGVSPSQNIILDSCPTCDAVSFLDMEGTWACRVCGVWRKPDWSRHGVGSGTFTWYVIPDSRPYPPRWSRPARREAIAGDR